MSYLAGVTATEWLLLYDFLDQDRAAVQVGGFLSGLMKFAAGIPQGRRFSLHTFTAAMHALRMIMDSACPALFCPRLQERPYLHLSIIAESVRGCLEAGWYDMARMWHAHVCSSYHCFMTVSVVWRLWRKSLWGHCSLWMI